MRNAVGRLVRQPGPIIASIEDQEVIDKILKHLGLDQAWVMVVAVRQALDYTSTGRAVAVVVLGFIVYIFVFVLLFSITGGGGPA